MDKYTIIHHLELVLKCPPLHLPQVRIYENSWKFLSNIEKLASSSRSSIQFPDTPKIDVTYNLPDVPTTPKTNVTYNLPDVPTTPKTNVTYNDTHSTPFSYTQPNYNNNNNNSFPTTPINNNNNISPTSFSPSSENEPDLDELMSRFESLKNKK